MALQGPSAAEQLEELKADYDRLKLQSEMHGAMAVGLEVLISCCISRGARNLLSQYSLEVPSRARR